MRSEGRRDRGRPASIDRLGAALSEVGPPVDARELSEILWLACHITGGAADPAAPPERDVPGGPAVPAPVAAPAPAVPASRPGSALHPPAFADVPGGGRAAGVLVPTAPMLADPLGVGRALRPLKRRVPSRSRRVLDEDATAARIAETGLWVPVLDPEPERWLTLDLVVDTGPAMRLWRPLARELTETLLRQGAFRDVRVSSLHPSGRVSSGLAALGRDAPQRDPATLLDPSRRRATLVLSDCSGPHWWDGRAGRAVRHWALAGPTAVLQPLPERLWRRTAAPAVPGLAALARPGGSSSELRFTPHDGDPGPGVPVPVLEVAPRWLAGWARLVSGAAPTPMAVTVLRAASRSAAPVGAAAVGAAPVGAAPVRRERELPVGERVRRFLVSASPGAAELAAHVAVSVPSLPVMRLIQQRVLGGTGPSQLAEVLLSGLLRPVHGSRYEFVPGARAALLGTLPRPEALHTRHVLEAVSAEIERRAGTSAETFRALLPSAGGEHAFPQGEHAFALLSPEARTLLDPTVDPADATTAPGGSAPGVSPVAAGAPPSEPAPPPIGRDGQDGPVSLDPLRDDGPHGLVVGDAPARHTMVRTIVTALAAAYGPDDLGIVLGGLGDHPFGAPAPLPHVVHDRHELLGDPDGLRDLLATLSAELDRRAERPAAVPSPLLAVVDVSLTLPSGKPEVAATLQRLAARGGPLGVHLLVSSTTWERTTAWERLLPLLSWRVAVKGASPQVLQRVMGQGSLHFPDEGRHAYLRRTSGAPQRFRMTSLPSVPVAPAASGASPGRVREIAPGILDRLTAEIDLLLEPGAARQAERILRDLVAAELGARPEDRRPGRAHLVFSGPPGTGKSTVATLFGEVLAELGVLPHGNLTRASWNDLRDRYPGETPSRAAQLFAHAQGGVLFIDVTDTPRERPVPSVEEILTAQMDEHESDLLVVLAGQAAGTVVASSHDLADRFGRTVHFDRAGDAGSGADGAGGAGEGADGTGGGGGGMDGAGRGGSGAPRPPA